MYDVNIKLKLSGSLKNPVKSKTKKSPVKPPKAAKGAYHHGNLKEDLLQHAKEMIQSRHDVQFTLRELAKRVGVSPMAAYRHFATKEDILRAIAAEGFMQLSLAFTEALKHDPADLGAIGAAYIDFSLRNPVHFKVMFHPELVDPSAPAPVDTGAFGILMQCIALNQERGLFPKSSCIHLAVAAWSMVHGLATLLINRNLGRMIGHDTAADSREMRDLIQTALQTVSKGFLSLKISSTSKKA